MRHRILLAGAFIYLAIGNVVWFAIDTRPPFWDMAVHQESALRILDAFTDAGWTAFPSSFFLTLPYPPVYHFLLAASFEVFGRVSDSAQWTSLASIGLVLASTYGLGRKLLDPIPAAMAAILVNFYPFMLWLSRETLIDYWLTAMVTLALWMLVQTESFSKRRWAVLLGVVCALGMLTKWTFVLFLALPFVWFARSNVRNASLAVITAAGLSGVWYWRALDSLGVLLRANVAGAVREGDPPRISVEALVFYLRGLEGYQLFLPLFILFLAGIGILFLRFNREWVPVILWLVGGWMGLLLFQNKDPRYSAPLLPAVALVSALVFQHRRQLVALVVPLLLFQHYLVSFGIPQLPPSVVLVKGATGPLQADWNLYTQNYFGVWGPPARQDWQIERVLAEMTADHSGKVQLGMVPDIPRFDTSAFALTITRLRLPVRITRIDSLEKVTAKEQDYFLVSDKDSDFGPAADTPDALVAIQRFIGEHSELFQVADSFSLPDGTRMFLYRTVR